MKLRFKVTPIKPFSDVFAIEGPAFEDGRGWFMETWRKEEFEQLGINGTFVQDNLVFSGPRGVLRGMHFQRAPFEQAKLVQCLRGRAFDVAVDLRRDSSTYGQWGGIELSETSRRQIWIPEGYAHGYCTLDADTLMSYKVTAKYSPSHEGSISWCDPDIAINWPVQKPIISQKDKAAPHLREEATV